MTEEINKIQAQIVKIVRNDNNASVFFQYEHLRDIPTAPHFVSAYTINAVTGETFLMHNSALCDSQLDCMKDILEYVEMHKRSYDSYTVRWSYKKDPKTEHMSHFFVLDMIDLVEKFFIDKDKSEYIVWEVKLNPIS